MYVRLVRFDSQKQPRSQAAVLQVFVSQTILIGSDNNSHGNNDCAGA